MEVKIKNSLSGKYSRENTEAVTPESSPETSERSKDQNI